MSTGPERASSLRLYDLKREISPEYVFITSPLVWLKHSALLLKNITRITELDPTAEADMTGASPLQHIH